MCTKVFSLLAFATCLLCGVASSRAQLTSPQIGWQAEINGTSHGVSGTVSIVDEDTLQIDDFTYDGGGIVVYFYLGVEDTRPAFTSGLSIGDDLFGTAFDGTQPPLLVDLPSGSTLEGYHAISVWCVAAGVSFGSGVFQPVAASADFDSDGDVDGRDFLVWQRDPSIGALADWQEQYGSPAAGQSSLATVPEPLGLALGLQLAVLCVAWETTNRTNEFGRG